MTGLQRRWSRPLFGAILALSIVAGSWTALAASPSPSLASGARQAASITDHIAEAARRFGLPNHWIRAVMRAESAFDPRATSHAGAMGLMQVMPGTYAELRARHGLGPDPYAPRDNVLAGAAYLREMYDAFGPSGFLAAYNAGPSRYRDHLATGRPLPLETRLYVAKVAPKLGGDVAAKPLGVTTGTPAAPPVDPRSAPLFVSLGVGAQAPVTGSVPAASTLFPRQTGAEAPR